MASIADRRARAFVQGALVPAFNSMLDRTHLQLLWASRALLAIIRNNPEEHAGALDAMPAGGVDACVDIAFLLEDFRLYDLGVVVGYFAKGATKPLLDSLEEIARRFADQANPHALLLDLFQTGQSIVLSPLYLDPQDSDITREQFENILPVTRELRTPAMRDCVQKLFFTDDTEWGIATAQVDFLIDELSRNFVRAMSADQLNSLSWSMSGAEDYEELRQMQPLLLEALRAYRGGPPRWQELQDRRTKLRAISAALAADVPLAANPTYWSFPAEAPGDARDWPQS